MSKQIRLMQSAEDEQHFWSAMKSRFDVGCIPWWMSAQPEKPQAPALCSATSRILFDEQDWQELRLFIEAGGDGRYMLIPRVGVVEWTQTERIANRYVVRARLFFEKAGVPWSSGSERIFNWAAAWIKKEYELVKSANTSVAIGPRLMEAVTAKEAELIYPNGSSLL